MKPDIMVMGICHPAKLSYLNQSLDSVDPVQDLFENKILAIDEFNGHKFPQPFINKFSSKNWTILIDNHKSRPKSILHALTTSNSEWVFYTEDDIVLEIPKEFDIKCYDAEIENKKLGMLSLNYGGIDLNFQNNEFGDLIKIKENLIYENEKLVCFKRDENLNDGHFFEFPGVFVKKDLFLACIEYCLKNYIGHQIERALTFAWFDLNIQQKYYKASMLKKQILDLNGIYTIQDLNECRFFKAIDPLQGHFAYGGRTEC